MQTGSLLPHPLRWRWAHGHLLGLGEGAGGRCGQWHCRGQASGLPRVVLSSCPRHVRSTFGCYGSRENLLQGSQRAVAGSLPRVSQTLFLRPLEVRRDVFLHSG